MKSNMLRTKKKGQLYVVSGPSACGKDSIVKKLLEKRNDLWLSISCTSRKPRPLEKDGVDYFFLTEEEFEEKITTITNDIFPIIKEKKTGIFNIFKKRRW